MAYISIISFSYENGIELHSTTFNYMGSKWNTEQCLLAGYGSNCKTGSNQNLGITNK